jgi:predicted molibdopterin-dependent oxidoreductase YjgC
LSRKLKLNVVKRLTKAKIKMKVTIDGQAIEVEPGTTILQAARMIGGESVPPAMCYYSKLEEAVENAVAA